MFCSNCNSPFEVTIIDNGKSRFCRNCGSLLYKNENNHIIFANNPQVEIDKEAERIRQEQLLEQRQQEIEQQKQAEAKRLKQEETLRLQQLEIQKKQDEEKEKLRQEQLIRERQLELERERIETERKLKEEEERAARELEEQKISAQQEKERLEREKLEKEIRAKILLEQEEERRQKEKEIQAQLDKEEQVRIEAEKQAHIKTELNDSDATEDPETEEPNKRSTLSKAVQFILLPLLLLSIAALITFYLVYPEDFKSLISKPGSAEIMETETASTDTPNNTDSLLTEQLKHDLTGKEVLSWGNLKQNEIQDLKIITVDENEDNISYVLELWLNDRNGTKGIAELNVLYNKIILTSFTTTKITYQNTAPVNAWFSFAPVADCDIFINTNSNPVLIKGCLNCGIVKMNTTPEQPEKLVNHPETIFIQSDTKSEAIIDFIYVPKK